MNSSSWICKKSEISGQTAVPGIGETGEYRESQLATTETSIKSSARVGKPEL